ncbi:MAG: PAS domain S-box protein [Candidatus Terrybacteria bacterium]|nr:PAS domain S-box protein [Candidatus Terrybacteria bacterium]
MAQEILRFLQGEKLDSDYGLEEVRKLLFQDHPIPMWIFDTVTLSILAVNAAAVRHYGYAEKQMLSMTLKEIWTAGQIIEFLNLLSKRSTEFYPAGVWTHRKRSGEVLHVKVAICPVRFAGRPAHLSVVVDITEEKEAKKMLALRMGGSETLDIIECERRRIGAELHDGVAQFLLGAELLCDSLRQKLEARGIPETTLAAEITGDLRQATLQMRRLAGLFFPPELEGGDLAAVLKGLVERTAGLSGILCAFDDLREGKTPDIQGSVHLYRIAQEAVTNAVKHSKARHLILRLRKRGRRIVILVADDGVGIAPQPGTGAGLGLCLMRHRAESIGASLKIRRRNSGGTIVRCSAPLA